MNYHDIETTITATEFKNNLGQYLESAIGGQEVIITKNGKKAVKLLPYESAEKEYGNLNEEAIDYQIERKSISYEEFMEINEKSEARMEYINGEIVLLASPNVYHQDISGRLHLILSSYLKGKKCRVYYAPFDVHLLKTNNKIPDVVQPDLLVACDIGEKTDAKGKYMGVPSLVIEILSPGTRTKDMVAKLNTYMLSGVREFWVTDPEARVVLVYGFRDFEIDHFTTYKPADRIRSYFFDGLEADVNEIFTSTW